MLGFWSVGKSSVGGLLIVEVQGTSTITRPNSDIAVSEWTSSNGNPLYDDIDEETPSDTDYITSPELTSTPVGATFGLTNSLLAGSYTISVRGRRTDTEGQMRVVLRDSGGTQVGATNWQTLTKTYTTYSFPITITGTATQSSVEARTAEAAFVPVTLVQENWANGFGPILGRTPAPISGSGTWQQNSTNFNPTVYFEPFYAYGTVQQGNAIFRHSVSFTDASITAIVTPAYAADGPLYAPALIWARSTPGPNTEPTDGYRVVCNNTFSGATPLISLQKVISGAASQIGSSSVDPTDQLVSFTVAGSTLTVKVNGTTVIQVTDTSIANAGYWGYGIGYFGSESSDAITRVGPITIQTAA